MNQAVDRNLERFPEDFMFQTMIFITHQVPKGLQVDEVVIMGQHAMHMKLSKGA